ncbi:putative SWEET sugar transporter [Helianthus anomalus]
MNSEINGLMIQRSTLIQPIEQNFRPTFIQIVKKGAVEQFSPVPYLATFVNCGIWVLYGLPMVHPDSLLVITIKGTGLFIETVYLLLFLIYSDRKQKIKV